VQDAKAAFRNALQKLSMTSWRDPLAVQKSKTTVARFCDAHRGDGKRYVVRADEILTALVELESAIRDCEDKSGEL
jgi:hypothetical protein